MIRQGVLDSGVIRAKTTGTRGKKKQCLISV